MYGATETFEDRIGAIREALDELANDLRDDDLYVAAEQYVDRALDELADIEDDLLKTFEVEFTVTVPFEATVLARDEDDALVKAECGEFESPPSGDVSYLDVEGYEVENVHVNAQ